ncbi:MAG TPA: sulfotransferase [Phycisphaeraceae bacterium]
MMTPASPSATQAPSDNARPQNADRLREPFFLVGAERSGTTLLRLMLTHHPQIAWCSEFEYATEQIPEAGGWPDLPAYRAWLASHRIFQAHGFAIDESLDYPRLMDSFLRQTRDAQGKPIIGATCHKWFDRLLRIWPDARFIHLVRDGRDVARSCIGMGWAGNVYHGSTVWIEAEQLWDRLAAQLEPGRWVEVRYESLIAQPQEELQRITAFMGVAFDPAMLRYAQNTSYAAPDPSLTQQWRRKLTPREIQLVEARIGDMLAARGYELSGLPRIRVGAMRRAALAVQNRLARIRFRQKRYGLGLWLADVVARRVGIGADRVRQATHRIDTAHLK